jgi:signal transduction histidine kinase
MESGHFGMQGMRERVERLGGTCEVTSARGAGTTVTARVPRTRHDGPRMINLA